MQSAEDLARDAQRKAEIQQMLTRRWGKRDAARRARLLWEIDAHLVPLIQREWRRLNLLADAVDAQQVIDYYFPRAQYLIENAPMPSLTRIEEEPTPPRRLTRLLMGLKVLANAHG